MSPVATSLRVNNKDIDLDNFTQSFLSSTVLGMLSTLRGLEKPEELDDIKVAVCDEDASMVAGGVEIIMNQFIRDFVRNTVKAMVAPLRGVDLEIKTVELNLFVPRIASN
jgi:hypothetical protein